MLSWSSCSTPSRTSPSTPMEGGSRRRGSSARRRGGLPGRPGWDPTSWGVASITGRTWPSRLPMSSSPPWPRRPRHPAWSGGDRAEYRRPVGIFERSATLDRLWRSGGGHPRSRIVQGAVPALQSAARGRRTTPSCMPPSAPPSRVSSSRLARPPAWRGSRRSAETAAAKIIRVAGGPAAAPPLGPPEPGRPPHDGSRGAAIASPW